MRCGKGKCLNDEEQEDVVSEHDVIFANLVKAVVSGIVSREAQQLPCLFVCLENLFLSQFLFTLTGKIV